jgi:hypothetical protein
MLALTFQKYFLKQKIKVIVFPHRSGQQLNYVFKVMVNLDVMKC